MKVNRLLRWGLIGVFIAGTGVLSGCSQIKKNGANIALRFTENNLITPLFKIDDTGMACVSGEALTPLIVATEGIKADPHEISTLLYASAGLCAEQRALEYELRYMRSSKANLIDDAQDARVMQKREAELAARRQYESYKHLEAYFEVKKKAPIGAKCPKFKRDFDQMVYLLGLLSGVQAMVNDIAAQQVVGVPKDIAAKVERAMQCLDNNKWWGAPMATRATIWTLLPGAGEGKGDPWETLKQNMRLGERNGVRLAHAMYALAAQAKGDEALMRDAIKAFAATQESASNPNYRLFDKMAFQLVQNVSDRFWTEKAGSRTPPGSLGKFWDDQPVQQDEGVQIDDLL
jgi:hypothetical protein